MNVMPIDDVIKKVTQICRKNHESKFINRYRSFCKSLKTSIMMTIPEIWIVFADK